MRRMKKTKKDLLKQIKGMNDEDFNLMLEMMGENAAQQQTPEPTPEPAKEETNPAPTPEATPQPVVTEPATATNNNDDVIKTLLESQKQLQEQVKSLIEEKPFGIQSQLNGSNPAPEDLEFDKILANLNRR